jgi:membrane fusion protein (multidrug efflux system)
LSQEFSAVKEAQGELIQVASQLGVVTSYDTSPEKMLADFYKRDPEGNIDRIYEQLARDAPVVKQAEAKLAEAQRNLDQARLDLRYCDVVAEIDGVVTRRSVNPGNNVVAGQALMAVRSLTDIWVDANFKETQLAALRIGQPVDLDVDMYGAESDSEVGSAASRWGPDRRWRCCRPKTPRATSSRSCSACPCAST